MGILALVAGQDVEPAEDSDGRDGRWRITRGTASGRMISTVDPESRHIHKTRSHQQDGYKAHLAVEPETGLFTAVALRPGAGPEHHEATVGLELLADEDTPVDAFGDTAYSTSNACQALEEAGHRLFLKPAPLRPAVPNGFTLDVITIDTSAATGTCPQGHTVGLSEPGGRHHQRRAVFGNVCTRCPLREQCTKAKAGRVLTIRPHHDLHAAVRRQAATSRTCRRLARSPRQPPTPLPGHHQQQRLAPHPSSRPQPPTPDQPRTHPHRRHLAPRTGHHIARGAARPTAGRPLNNIFIRLLGSV